MQKRQPVEIIPNDLS